VPGGEEGEALTVGMSDKEVKMKMKVHAKRGIKPSKGGPDALRRQLGDLEATAKAKAQAPVKVASTATAKVAEVGPAGAGAGEQPLEERIAAILEAGRYSPDTEGDNRALASKIAQSVKKKAKWEGAERSLKGFLAVLPKAFESRSVQRLSQGVFCADLLKYIWNEEQKAAEKNWRQQEQQADGGSGEYSE
jgi:hypothetical protein